MSRVKTAYVPQFGSQRGSSQRDEPQTDLTEPPCQKQRGKRGNTRSRLSETTRFPLKVKLPQFTARTSFKNKATKEGETPARWMLIPAANTAQSSVSGAEESRDVGTDLDPVGEDVFFFSQRSTRKPTNEKDKAKLAVLRTISKMLEENHIIRQRLITLSQAR